MDIELKYKIAERIIEINDDVLLNEIKELVGLTNLQSNPPAELTDMQKKLLDERLLDYNKNPNDVLDFETMIDEIEKGL